MNAGVDFAAGGIVLSEEKILLVKNKKGDSSKDNDCLLYTSPSPRDRG